MKRFYLILIVFISSFMFVCSVSASSDYRYLGSIDNCYISGKSLYSSSDDIVVYIYEVYPTSVNFTFSFTFISGTRLRYFTSSSLVNVCSTPSDVNPFYGYYVENNPVPNSVYTYSLMFNSSNDIVNPSYLYMFLSNVSGVRGVTSMGTVVSEPEQPHVPAAVIPDTDFYLFYDFAAISDFDVFSDYDFTSFTDFEKLTITIIVNIFYLGFIVFCIYIILKGLYKMLSWVFR